MQLSADTLPQCLFDRARQQGDVAYIVEHSRARLIFVEDEEQLDKVLRARHRLPALEKIVVFDWRGLRGFSDPMTTRYHDLVERGQRFGAAWSRPTPVSSPRCTGARGKPTATKPVGAGTLALLQ